MRHPYGIWNDHSANNSVGCVYYETSLWDLKHDFNSYEVGKVVLWDIPMGFETFSIIAYPITWSIMRHPYGIWNHFIIRKFNLWLHYETSLWDLKHALAKTIYSFCLLWDIPMGFETYNCPVIRIFSIHYETSLWDLKRLYGDGDITLVVDYETSLWDLKLNIIKVKTWTIVIMRHPYGIWNHKNIRTIMEDSSLWDIPMGFETCIG